MSDLCKNSWENKGIPSEDKKTLTSSKSNDFYHRKNVYILGAETFPNENFCEGEYCDVPAFRIHKYLQLNLIENMKKISNNRQLANVIFFSRICVVQHLSSRTIRRKRRLYEILPIIGCRRTMPGRSIRSF